jgi:hypothetical protein
MWRPQAEQTVFNICLDEWFRRRSDNVFRRCPFRFTVHLSWDIVLNE